MSSLATVLSHTPLYVWAILAYLVWQGWRSLRTRSQSLWRMTLVPLGFAVSGIALLLRDGVEGHERVWLCAAAITAVLGAITAPRILAGEPGRSTVTRAGSPVPLVRNLLVFGAHYGIAVSAALHQDEQGRTMIAAAGLSGATVGYVAGWALATFKGYQAARLRACLTTGAGLR